MLFWFVYSLSGFYISYVLSTFFPVKIRVSILFLLLALMITPENMGIDSLKLNPVVFSFLFDLIFEQNVSWRLLRPLALSIPLFLLVAFFFEFFKKRFS